MAQVICLGVFLLCMVAGCCSPPTEDWIKTPKAQGKVSTLENDFLRMLPSTQLALPQAREEARWLAQTAYEQSGAIGRAYKAGMLGWFNNMRVHAGFQKRGLCYHYQHDMYRELRRKKLVFFRVGFAVRDEGKKREHNCVYVAAKDSSLAWGIILDPWLACGKLKVLYPHEHAGKTWKDSNWIYTGKWYYPEDHGRPFTHEIPSEHPKEMNPTVAPTTPQEPQKKP